MKLISVYSEPEAAKILYELLSQREAHESISHKEMPSWEDHVRFVRSKPYDRWWLIEDHGSFLGSVYVTRRYEVGIHIFPEHRGKGTGSWALAKVRAFYERPLLANINPDNEGSVKFFQKHGFKLIQHTYESE